MYLTADPFSWRLPCFDSNASYLRMDLNRIFNVPTLSVFQREVRLWFALNYGSLPSQRSMLLNLTHWAVKSTFKEPFFNKIQGELF